MSDVEYSDEDYYDEEDEDMIDAGDEDTSEEDAMMDSFDASAAKGKGKEKAYDVPYTSLTQAQVEKAMADQVEHISGIFGVEASVASLLLRYMDWNKEKLIEKYMDDPDAVSVAAGVMLPPPKEEAASRPSRQNSGGVNPLRRLARRPTAESAKPAAPPKADPKAPFLCAICFDESQQETLALACEHSFCAACWADYAVSRIRLEGEPTIRCMQEGCALVAPDAFVQRALARAEAPAATLERFRGLLVRQYVGCMRDLKFCPYPSCTHTVSCPGAATRAALATVVPTVVCGASAEHVFCFGCDIEGDHRPCVCLVARMWLKKCADDSETANWIKSNTKECTKCQSTIEKNGGCNHMTCKKCKWEFCWVCMGPWSDHGTSWYSCNRFDDKAGVEARDAQAKSRASLERYLHYYNRWANHEQSAKLQVELYAKTEQKMEAMQVSSVLTWIEVQFMKKAVDELSRCRTTLKWTYAMAYYLEKGNEKELFEDNQRDLERAVEDLSELLEGPIEAENIPVLRQKVTDKTVYVSKRNEIMLEDTAKGFADGRWRWNMPVEGFD